MHATRKVKLKDLSPNLTCHICHGYFIDATTIIECLHSFCRSCIVQHLEQSEYCPVCDVELHSTKPLSSIRSDQMLQEIVYKLVPGLFQGEMAKRRSYYRTHCNSKPKSQQDGGQVFNESYITSDDLIHLSLEFETSDEKLRESTKRYFQCPAAVSIAILKKLVQGKYDLKNSNSIDIMYRERYLPDDFLLMDIAYKYSWSQNTGVPLQLHYRIHGFPTLPLTEIPTTQSNSNSSKKVGINKRGTKTSRNAGITTPLIIPNPAKVLNKLPPISQSEKPRPRPYRKREAIVAIGEVPVDKIKSAKVEKSEKIPRKYNRRKQKEKQEDTVSQSLPLDSPSTEVELRISENGVISATNVSSGKEKIIKPSTDSSIKKSVVPIPSVNGFRRPIPDTLNTESTTTNSCMTSLNVDNDKHDVPVSLSIKDKVTQDEPSIPSRLEFVGRAETDVKLDKTELPSDIRGAEASVLKVPTPSKWKHLPNPANGNLKFTTAPSPVKDGVRFNLTPQPLTPKKPPKFFKSRISETNITIQHTLPSERVQEPEGKKSPCSTANSFTGSHYTSPFKNSTSASTTATYTNGSSSLRTSPKNSDCANGLHPLKDVFHHSQPHSLSHQYSNYGYQMDDNMNLGPSTGYPLQFVSSMSNSYLPYFTNHIPYMANALAMTMNMNSAYSPYYPPSIPTSDPPNITALNGHGSSSKSSFIDLSVPAKKPKTVSGGYVHISPKKNYLSTEYNEKDYEKPIPQYNEPQMPATHSQLAKAEEHKKTPDRILAEEKRPIANSLSPKTNEPVSHKSPPTIRERLHSPQPLTGLNRNYPVPSLPVEVKTESSTIKDLNHSCAFQSHSQKIDTGKELSVPSAAGSSPDKEANYNKLNPNDYFPERCLVNINDQIRKSASKLISETPTVIPTHSFKAQENPHVPPESLRGKSPSTTINNNLISSDNNSSSIEIPKSSEPGM